MNYLSGKYLSNRENIYLQEKYLSRRHSMYPQGKKYFLEEINFDEFSKKKKNLNKSEKISH
jgi:hypothetical protein